ncbi:hypothetical protein EV182_008495, partial [Spiromyces aspiralis]
MDDDEDDEELVNVRRVAIDGITRSNHPWIVPVTIVANERSLDVSAELDTGAEITGISQALATQLGCSVIPANGTIEFGLIGNRVKRIGTTCVKIIGSKAPVEVAAEVFPGNIQPPLLIGRDLLVAKGLPYFADALLKPSTPMDAVNDADTSGNAPDNDSNNRSQFLEELHAELATNRAIDPVVPCPLLEAR